MMDFLVFSFKAMAPKKRRKTLASTDDGKAGAVRKYLADNFSDLPPNGNDCLKGHMLHVYYNISNKSQTGAARELLNFFMDAGADELSLKNSIKSGVKRTVESFEKYKKPTDEGEMAKRAAICQKKFSI